MRLYSILKAMSNAIKNINTVTNITLTYNSGLTTKNIKAFKIGKIVVLSGHWVGSITGTSAAIVTIPSAYRPSATQYIDGVMYSTALLSGFYTVYTNGKVVQTNTSGTVTYGSLFGMWTV